MLEAAHQIGTKIAAAKNVSLDASIPSRREVQHSVWRDIAPGLLLPAIFLVMVFFAMMGKRGGRGYRRSGLPFFIPMGGWGGGGSHSGGGFGGYDSSDSFGGFGGGDSGGGGASSDW